jgi:hypothetical protein
MSAKISPAQRAMIDAIKNGAKVKFMSGYQAYAYADRPCPGVKNLTVTALAMERAGLLERCDHRTNGNFSFRLTAKGEAA